MYNASEANSDTENAPLAKETDSKVCTLFVRQVPPKELPPMVTGSPLAITAFAEDPVSLRACNVLFEPPTPVKPTVVLLRVPEPL